MREDEWRRLHPASILIVALQQGRALVLALATVVLSSRSAQNGLLLLELTVAVLGLTALLPAIFRYLALKYRIADGVFMLRSGVVFRQSRTIPLERIQNVSIKRTLLQRLMGVSTVQIETASGAGVEAELSVIGAADARALVDELRGVGAESAPAELDEPIYRATTKQLLMAGVTQNRAGVILLFVLGLFNYAQDLIGDGWTKAVSVPARHEFSQVSMALGMVVILAGLILVGWILSVVMVIVKYYGFTLRRERGLLKVKHGLFTQIQAVLRSGRVQTLRVESPILQRKLGYCQVLATSAASFSEKDTGGAAQLSPLLERRRATSLLQLVFDRVDIDSVDWKRVSRLAIRRNLFRYTVVGLILLGVLDIAFGRSVFLFFPLLAVFAVWAANRHYRVLAYALQDGFFYTRHGIWRRRLTVVPEDRIQWVALTQGPVQQRLRLCSLVIATAAAGEGVLALADLDYPDGLALQERLLSDSADPEPVVAGGL